MTTALRHITIIVLAVLMFDKTYAQDTTTANFFDQIKTYNLSTVLAADSILNEEREDRIEKF